jgi:hypothetical protein
MHVQIACMLCSIDASTANLLVPLAQATIIATPILVRDQVRRGVRAVRDRAHGEEASQAYDAGDDAIERPTTEPADS